MKYEFLANFSIGSLAFVSWFKQAAFCVLESLILCAEQSCNFPQVQFVVFFCIIYGVLFSVQKFKHT